MNKPTRLERSLPPNTLTTHDAVVVIPGIMGSALRDTRTGKLVWGLSDPRWYARAWTSPNGLRTLHVTDEERAGGTGHIKPRRRDRPPGLHLHPGRQTRAIDQLWDPAAPKNPVTILGGHTRRIRTLLPLIEDGRPILLSAAYDQTLRIWDPQTGELLKMITLGLNIAAMTRTSTGITVATDVGLLELSLPLLS